MTSPSPDRPQRRRCMGPGRRARPRRRGHGDGVPRRAGHPRRRLRARRGGREAVGRARPRGAPLSNAPRRRGSCSACSTTVVGMPNTSPCAGSLPTAPLETWLATSPGSSGGARSAPPGRGGRTSPPTTGEGSSSTWGCTSSTRPDNSSVRSRASTPRSRAPGRGRRRLVRGTAARLGGRVASVGERGGGRPRPRLRVLGSGAAFVVDHLDGQEEALRAGRRPDEADFGIEPPERWGRLVRGDAGEPVASERGRWSAFYAGVVQALRGLAPPPSIPETGQRCWTSSTPPDAAPPRAPSWPRHRAAPLTSGVAGVTWVDNIRNRI